MKKIVYILAMSLGMVLAAACQEETAPEEKPYFEVSPASMDSETTLGDGDAVVISIKTNLAWTISVEYTGAGKDWLKFDRTEGEGSADVFGIILRGSLEGGRDCTVTVATKDGSKEPVVLQIKQGIFVPKIFNLTLLDVINTAGEAGVAKELLDYSRAAVQVAVKEKAENILTEEGCVIVTDGNNFVKVKLPGASALKEGDNLVLDLTEGTVMKENGGGFVVNLTKEPVSKEAGTLDIKPAYIASTSVGGYPYALVKVGACQATDSFVGKTWGAGTVTMDMVENEVGTVDIAVDSKASFAGTAVPGNSGTVIGFSIDGKVHPRNAEDLAGLSESRTKKYEIVNFKIKPVVNLLQSGSTKNTFVNTSNVGTTRVEFSDSEGYSYSGAAIEMNTSTKIAYVVEANSTQSCFTTIGWQPGKSYYQYEVPIQEKTWGDLEFGFSVSHGTAANLPWEWEITWSKDNSTYKPVEELYCIGSNEIISANVVKQKSNGYADSRYLALISIPESEAMQQGDKLFFRCNLKSATKSTTALTVRMNSGFYLASAAKNDPAPQYDNILAAENFDNCKVGLDLVIGAPLDYFAAWTTQTAYPARNGWTVSGGKAAYKSMLVFSGDPAVFSPKLSKLTGTSDVTIKFKICLFTSQDRANSLPNASGRQTLKTFKVTAIDGGTAQDIEWETDPESDYYNWHTATCRISGATPETSISISSEAATGKFYIKDIIITK